MFPQDQQLSPYLAKRTLESIRLTLTPDSGMITNLDFDPPGSYLHCYRFPRWE